MTIVRAKKLGMCMGVKRALELAAKAGEAGTAKGKKVLSYGPLIHNAQATARLEEKGVGILDAQAFDSGELAEEARNAIIVIRAHGAPPQVFARLMALGAEIVDATCPRVLRSQQKARELAARGYRIIIAGDGEHAEVAGLVGQVPAAFVVQNAEEAKGFFDRHPGLERQKLAILAQSTIQKAEYAAITKALTERAKECMALDTLCPASAERQAALAELAGQVSVIVVVGGKNSANTQRLAAAARAAGKLCWHIETAAELPPEVFSFDRIGLTAGASTPDFIVDEVESYLIKGARNGSSP